MDTDDPNLNPHRDAERRRFFASIKWPVHSRVVSATFENPKGDNKRAREGESEATKVVGGPLEIPYTYHDGLDELTVTGVGPNWYEEDDGTDRVRLTREPRRGGTISLGMEPKSIMYDFDIVSEIPDW